MKIILTLLLREWTEKPKIQNPFKKDTAAYHIFKYIESVMDALDKNKMNGVFIVMDNCRYTAPNLLLMHRKMKIQTFKSCCYTTSVY